ncbi:MAG: rod shape-determining protein [Planctomycetota bacterium]|nr:MAG: rod shape-determining protein [Planctomycetota bacterium]
MLHRLLGLLGYDLAIDLGTANTLVSVVGEGLVVNEPSIVAVAEGTSRILSGGCAIGHLAKQMQGRTPQSIEVVRPLGDGVIRDFELCEAMLRYFMRKAHRPGLARPRVLVAVPGGITPVERRAVFNSTQRAGAREVLVVPEAKAAAIGSGLPIAEPVASMICDIGGGTTEVAVLSLGEIVASQSVRTAGDAMDRALVDYLRRHYNLRVGTSEAERLRIEIGSAYPLEQELVGEVRGVDAIGRLPRKATITSEEVRESLAEPLGRIVEAIKHTLDRCSTDLVSDLADNGLVLAGGGALLPGLDRWLSEQTGLPTRLCGDPLTAVARGTHVCLEHFDRWRGALRSGDEDL